jgi:hypothetical protein
MKKADSNLDKLALLLERAAAQKKSEQSLELLSRGRPVGDEEGTVYCSVPGCNNRAFNGLCARHSADRRSAIRNAQSEVIDKFGIKKLV